MTDWQLFSVLKNAALLISCSRCSKITLEMMCGCEQYVHVLAGCHVMSPC